MMKSIKKLTTALILIAFVCLITAACSDTKKTYSDGYVELAKERMKHYAWPSEKINNIAYFDEFEAQVWDFFVNGKILNKDDIKKIVTRLGYNPQDERVIAFFSTWMNGRVRDVFKGYINALVEAGVEFNEVSSIKKGSAKFDELRISQTKQLVIVSENFSNEIINESKWDHF